MTQPTKQNGAEPQMQASVETVTPQMAMAWLTNAARNRPVANSVVRKYGREMEAGRWTLNGQGIVFSAEGKLLDGRHRLTAIVATSVEVQMLVVRGAKEESFETMDSGRARSLANVLAIEGRKNTTALSACARLVWNYAAGVNLKFAPTRSELLDLIHRHPLVEEYATLMANRDNLIKPLGLPKSAFAAVLALANDAHDHDQDVTEFIDGTITGEGLFRGDPRLALRRWLAKERASVGVGGARIGEPFFAAAARAWTAFEGDRDVTQLKIPMFFNIETLPIAGFDRARWGDVPDLSRYSFAALGPEPLSGDPDLAKWQTLGKGDGDSPA